jgi:hypothetical protein
VGDHLIAEDDRQADRDQGLTQLLALVPSQEDLLDHEPDRADHQPGEHRRDEPRNAVLDEAEPYVRAEQVERAVGHVDHAHEAEDQSEAARGDEVEPREAEAVEADDDELRRVPGAPQPLAEGLVEHPEHGGQRNGDRQ